VLSHGSVSCPRQKINGFQNRRSVSDAMLSAFVAGSGLRMLGIVGKVVVFLVRGIQMERRGK
jgi:hypothetical protein